MDGIQSVNSQAIVTEFCNHYYLVIWQRPLNFRKIIPAHLLNPPFLYDKEK